MIGMAMATANSYIQDDSGTYIPATQRPDGSWRKARRVKDGYIPQEEMPLYESKGKQWAKNRSTYPVGLDPKYVVSESAPRTIPGLTVTVPPKDENAAPTKSSKKKKKKKSESPKVDSVSGDLEKLNISGSDKTNSVVSEELAPKSQQPSTIDPAKRLRNLKKKVRDINALKQKIDSGELPNPDKDQLEKISRKEMIEAEIEDLELELATL